MQARKRQKILTLVVLWSMIALVLAWPSAVQGQGNVRSIPVPLMAFSTALSPDGKTLAVAADSAIYNSPDPVDALLRTIYLIDLTSGKETAALLGPQTDFANGLAFSPDGTRLVSVHDNGQLNVWDAAHGTILKTYRLPGLGYEYPRFLPDGIRVAVLNAIRPASLVIIDIQTGAITASYGPTISTRAGVFNAKFPNAGDFMYFTFAVSPDGKTFATVTTNDELDVWDAATGKMTVLFQPTEKKMMLSLRPVQFTPDSKSVVYYYQADNKLHVVDLATHKEQDISITGGDHFALNANGNRIAWIDKSQVYTWNFHAATSTKVADLDSSLRVQPNRTVTYFTPDGKQLIVADLAALGSAEAKNLVYVITLPVSG